MNWMLFFLCAFAVIGMVFILGFLVSLMLLFMEMKK